MENIELAIKQARESSKKRNFLQTWDFSVNLKNINLKRPENRINAELELPYGTGRETKIAIFADVLAEEAKKHADLVITKAEMESLANNKKKIKKIVNSYDWFFGEAPLMPFIGKNFGVVMGPRNKVPKPVPPNARLEPIINKAKNSVRIVLKENPVIHVPVGRENMEDKKIAENAMAVINFLKEKLPKGQENIKSAYIKLTMGKPVKINVK